MSRYYPYGFRWFQDGGSVLPGTIPSPREMAMYVAMQKAFAPAPAQKVIPSPPVPEKKGKLKKRIIPPPPEPRMRGDIGVGLPTREEMADLIQQRVAEQQRLQGQLERVGYKGAYAAAMSRQGRGKLPENVQDKLENLESSDYRVKHHPDYDPSKSVDDQQYLNYDNSFRTTVLRGANMFTDSGNPVGDFVAGAVTAPGRAFANIVLDAPKRYVNPIVEQGWRGVPESVGNLGMDVMTLVGEGAIGNRVANRLASRGLPEASAAMENQVLRFYTPGTPRAGRISREVADEASDVDDGLYHDITGIQIDDSFGGGSSSRSGKKPVIADSPVRPKSRSGRKSDKRVSGFQTDDLFAIDKTGSPFNTDKATKEEIKKAALDYLNLTKDPRYTERVRALDKELGLNGELERRLKLFQQQGETTKGDDLPFGIKINELIGALGRSRVSDDVLDKLDEDLISGRISELKYKQELGRKRYYTPEERTIELAPKAIKAEIDRSIPNTTSHELKHHWTSGVNDPDAAPYATMLASIAEPFPEAKLLELYKNPELVKALKKQHEYFTKPTELDAYVMTNFRDMLVKKGYLKDHFDELTEEGLGDFLDKMRRDKTLRSTGKGRGYFSEPLPDWVDYYFNPKRGVVKDKKKFVDVFNKALPVATGVVAGAGVMSGQEEQKQWGGGVPGVRWFQDGGNVLPGTIPSPREMAMHVAMQKAFAPAPAQMVIPSPPVPEKGEQKKRIIPPPAEPRMRGDLPMNFGLPTRGQVEGLIQQGATERTRLQEQLERVGYKGVHANAMVNRGRSKLPEHVKKQLEHQEASDYRVQHHPDYDPSKSVEDQQYLNNDNSFRTTVLRGANMFTDSGNPVMDFVAGAVTAPGRAFANLTMDAENRYWNPGLAQGALNFGMDALTLFPSVQNKAASAIVNRASSRGLGYLANPAVQGTEDVGRWYIDQAARSGTVRKVFPIHSAFAKNVRGLMRENVPLRDAMRASYVPLSGDDLEGLSLVSNETPFEAYKKMSLKQEQLAPGMRWKNDSYSMDSYPLTLDYATKKLNPKEYNVVPNYRQSVLNSLGYKSPIVQEALPENLQGYYKSQLEKLKSLEQQKRGLQKELSELKTSGNRRAITQKYEEFKEIHRAVDALQSDLSSEISALTRTDDAFKGKVAQAYNDRIAKLNNVYGIQMPLAQVYGDHVRVPQFFIQKKSGNPFMNLFNFSNRMGLYPGRNPIPLPTPANIKQNIRQLWNQRQLDRKTQEALEQLGMSGQGSSSGAYQGNMVGQYAEVLGSGQTPNWLRMSAEEDVTPGVIMDESIDRVRPQIRRAQTQGRAMRPGSATGTNTMEMDIERIQELLRRTRRQE